MPYAVGDTVETVRPITGSSGDHLAKGERGTLTADHGGGLWTVVFDPALHPKPWRLWQDDDFRHPAGPTAPAAPTTAGPAPASRNGRTSPRRRRRPRT